MKPKRPAKLITLPDKSEDSIMNNNRVLSTFSPKDLLVWSPKDRTFKS